MKHFILIFFILLFSTHNIYSSNKHTELQGEAKKLYNAYKSYYTLTYSHNNEDEKIIELTSEEKRGTFLNKPGNRMRKIKKELLNASKMIIKEQGILDSFIVKIINNERRIASGNLNSTQKTKMIKTNIEYFKQIEIIRIKIAKIQLKTAQRIFEIEKSGYYQIEKNAKQQLLKIKNNPSAYWLSRRNQLLGSAELKETLNRKEILKLYK